MGSLEERGADRIQRLHIVSLQELQLASVFTSAILVHRMSITGDLNSHMVVSLQTQR